MLLWISIAVLTAAAALAVLAPLGRAAKPLDASVQARRVYLDQLQELERDRAAARISDADAETARAEIARRLIAVASDGSDGAPVSGSLAGRRTAAVVALAGVPALSLTLYLSLGAPHLPGQPLAPRLAAAGAADDIELLVAKVEGHLAQSPEDGRGWDVIAPVYSRLGRPQEAATAYRNAIRILGSSAARQVGLGEALVTGEGGVVTADARIAFEAAKQAEPGAPAPRFYLGLAAEQEGDIAAAAAGWRALLAEAPADAPWRAPVAQALARVDPARAPTGPSVEPVAAGNKGPGGPNAEQVAAAQGMAPADRSAMIEGMVAGLAEKLKSEPDDVEGWLRLIRSYAVLGRAAEAQEAAETALKGLNAAQHRERVAALVADLGIGRETASP